MSNVALVTVLLPVVFGIAEQLDVPVLALALPVTFAASCAFMMPISTPPNAIVYSSGMIKVDQMMKAGFWLNVFATVIIALFGWFMLA
jgi:sodium-dependent dicarboxylate transporter 2/3/5